jgi:Helicase conserved C-terminal domain/SNF2-related domain
LLAEHQLDAVDRALVIIDAFGGVVLADEPGLGKSFVAAEIARRMRCDVELIVPASLVAQWRELELDATILTHDGVITAPFIAQPSRRRLVIVDEAHAFRNPRTQRYDALARRTLAARVVLVTATPVCNSAGDLHALIALIAPDDALRGVGIPSIDVAFERRDFDTIERIVAVFVIRRGRSVLPPFLQFGDLRRSVIRHTSHASIDALEFPLTGSAPLLRQFLWRRLESSESALLESARRQRRFYERVLESGRALTKRDYRRAFANEEDGDAFQQLLFWDLFVPGGEAIDVDAIREEMQRLDDLHPSSNKLELLRNVLTDEPALIFTTFRATARELGIALHTPIGAIDAFRAGRIDRLISTDVAAEGLNLQRAAIVIHYDIPWNPVKLDQRNGRAHRIGQTRDTIRAIYFLPDEDHTTITRVIAAKEHLRNRVLSVAPPPPAALATAIRPRIPSTSPALQLMQRLHLPERRNKAGLERLIIEMSRELIDDARIEHLLSIVRAECG